ncbi:MAG: CHAT domain-containing protein [Candidatus Sulfotelmatobacter sp.]
MEYKDITVHISPGAAGSFSVRVESGEGTINYEVALPFTRRDLDGVLSGTSRDLSFVGHTGPTVAGVKSAEDFGKKLYEALFQEAAKIKLAETRTAARYTPNTGVRIRLSMDLKGAGMTEVASLPWELMCPTDERPLAVSTHTPLVRSLDVPQPTDRRPFQPPLRILALMANPTGTAPLNLDKERSRIEASWARLPGVKVDFLAPGNPLGMRPTRSDLLKQVANAEYHVIHFMGHGDFNPGTGGVLMLERDDGSGDPVTSEELADMLEDEPIRLFFLNACKTATTSLASSANPFAGIATSLIRDGVPAVVAMQFPISDEAAVNFAQTFYERIAQRLPVDAAVAEGRKALYSNKNAEWATPVLFLRSRNGELFNFAPGDMPPTTTVSSPAIDDLWGAGAADKFRILLASTTEALRPVHRQLESELSNEGIRVFSSIPPPYDAREHAERVQALVRSADMCVHLLGDRPGEPLDGTTYPLEQLRIAIEAANSQLLLVPEDVDMANIEDRKYADYIRDLIDRPRETCRFELVRTGRYQMKDEILAKRRRLDQARQAQKNGSASCGALRSAFVDLHSKDLGNAVQLITYLQDKGITPLVIPSGDKPPSEAMSLFEEMLSKALLYVVVFGSVTRDWVVNRLNQAFQSANKTAGMTTCFGVYLAPPVKGAEQVKFAPFVQKVGNMASFDPSSVDVLIQRALE